MGLIDAGAQVSYMSREYSENHGYEIKPLDNIISISGSGGSEVPYIGYVEANLKIPEIKAYNQDVLFLIGPRMT